MHLTLPHSVLQHALWPTDFDLHTRVRTQCLMSGLHGLTGDALLRACWQEQLQAAQPVQGGPVLGLGCRGRPCLHQTWPSSLH